MPNSRSHLHIVRNDASPSEADVIIYDEIAWYALDAQELIRALRQTQVDTLNVRINSPGGSVFDGLAIANTLRDHSARVITHVDGMAASIASIIAIAGDEVRMANNAFMMIHNPYTVTVGDAKALRKEADTLDKIGASLVAEYQQRTGATTQQVQDWMDAETWFNAEDAKSNGFADTIVGKKDSTANDAAAKFDLSRFAHAPAALVARAGREESASEVLTVRELERGLREAGLSRSDARRVALVGHPLIGQRDAVHGASEEVKSALRKLITNFQQK